MTIPLYVIMPNHVHLIVVCSDVIGGRTRCLPTVWTTIWEFSIGGVWHQIRRYKNSIEPNISSAWQPRYPDHIVHNQLDELYCQLHRKQSYAMGNR